MAVAAEKGTSIKIEDRLSFIAGGLLHSSETQSFSSAGLAKDQERIAQVLSDKGDGSALCGWRRELDTHGWLEIGFQQFCQALVKWGIEADIFGLLGLDGNAESLSLQELLPRQGALVERFREWVKAKFGNEKDGMFHGSEGLFSAVDPENQGYLTRGGFLIFCEEQGFAATQEELDELWTFLDPDADEQVKREELLFLETDVKARGAELHKQRMRAQFDEDRLLAKVYWDGNRKLAPKHRLAHRPWEAESYEQLPVVAWQRKLVWRKRVRHRVAVARATLLNHLRTTFGHEVRAWRRGLDPDSKFVVSLISLRCYCRKMELDIDVPMAWRGFDKDGDGRFHMEDLAPKLATALAFLRTWARHTFGDCARLWAQPKVALAVVLAEEQGEWVSRKKIPVKVFARLLKDFGWPGTQYAGSKAICSALDLYGCGFICQTDLEWLDKWQPPEWLIALPDQDALDELQRTLLKVGGQPLHVWRRFLDTDDTNCVSWIEFENACEQVKFRGNVSGAWRCLDKDSNGSISLTEYDPPSADLLGSFKEWAEENFGSVERMFKAIDTDGSGQLSFPELRRACRNGRWQGDVRLLFDCLDIDSSGNERIGGGDKKRRTLSYKEIAFLDAWVPDEVHEEAPGQRRRASVSKNRRMSIGSLLGDLYLTSSISGPLNGLSPAEPSAITSPSELPTIASAGWAAQRAPPMSANASRLPRATSGPHGKEAPPPRQCVRTAELPTLAAEGSKAPDGEAYADNPASLSLGANKLPPATPSTGVRANPHVDPSTEATRYKAGAQSRGKESGKWQQGMDARELQKAESLPAFLSPPMAEAYSTMASSSGFTYSSMMHVPLDGKARKLREAQRLAKLARTYNCGTKPRKAGAGSVKVSARSAAKRL
mmetsp:Transcript_60067/g.143083  ORF Transcript_60067/g.143083 Transcript_60067/m.143083 type:complete len:886 (+) Transcript_60067:152-2809(+)